MLIKGDEPYIEIEATRPNGAYHRSEGWLCHPVLPAGDRRLCRAETLFQLRLRLPSPTSRLPNEWSTLQVGSIAKVL